MLFFYYRIQMLLLDTFHLCLLFLKILAVIGQTSLVCWTNLDNSTYIHDVKTVLNRINFKNNIQPPKSKANTFNRLLREEVCQTGTEFLELQMNCKQWDFTSMVTRKLPSFFNGNVTLSIEIGFVFTGLMFILHQKSTQRPQLSKKEQFNPPPPSPKKKNHPFNSKNPKKKETSHRKKQFNPPPPPPSIHTHAHLLIPNMHKKRRLHIEYTWSAKDLNGYRKNNRERQGFTMHRP